MHALVLIIINLHTKYEVPNFPLSKDMMGRHKILRCHLALTTTIWGQLLNLRPTIQATCGQNLTTRALAIPEIHDWRLKKNLNGSHNMDNAHLGVACHPKAKIGTDYVEESLRTLAVARPEMWDWSYKNLKCVAWHWPRPFQGQFVIHRLELAVVTGQPKHQIWSLYLHLLWRSLVQETFSRL